MALLIKHRNKFTFLTLLYIQPLKYRMKNTVEESTTSDPLCRSTNQEIYLHLYNPKAALFLRNIRGHFVYQTSYHRRKYVNTHRGENPKYHR
jgi:hypothetical protein